MITIESNHNHWWQWFRIKVYSFHCAIKVWIEMSINLINNNIFPFIVQMLSNDSRVLNCDPTKLELWLLQLSWQPNKVTDYRTLDQISIDRGMDMIEDDCFRLFRVSNWWMKSMMMTKTCHSWRKRKGRWLQPTAAIAGHRSFFNRVIPNQW